MAATRYSRRTWTRPHPGCGLGLTRLPNQAEPGMNPNRLRDQRRQHSLAEVPAQTQLPGHGLLVPFSPRKCGLFWAGTTSVHGNPGGNSARNVEMLTQQWTVTQGPVLAFMLGLTFEKQPPGEVKSNTREEYPHTQYSNTASFPKW